MATPAQIEANRRNSQKSTGPRSEAGKLTCSQNAFKSGIYAEAPLVTGEDPAGFDDLVRAYRDTWRPSNPDEHALVDTLVHTEWLTRRMRRVETQLWNRRTDSLHESSFYEGDPAYELAATWGGIQEDLDRIQRRLSALERISRRALADLRRLRADRPLPANAEPAPPPAKPIAQAPSIGFVPSEASPAARREAASPTARSVAPVPIGFVPSNSCAAREAAAAPAPGPQPLLPPRDTLTA